MIGKHYDITLTPLRPRIWAINCKLTGIKLYDVHIRPCDVVKREILETFEEVKDIRVGCQEEVTPDIRTYSTSVILDINLLVQFYDNDKKNNKSILQTIMLYLIDGFVCPID